MTPNSTPHLLWARPVSQVPLLLSLHAYTALLPALHAFRLCHQYGNSNSFLLPPLSRLPLSLATRIERYLIAAYRREIHSRWNHRLETASRCDRCLTAPTTREEELRRQICHCRTVFRRDVEIEVRRLFVEKGCGKEMWDGRDEQGVMTTGMFLRRFCGLELFVEGGSSIGEGLWLCLPFEMKGGGGGDKEGEKGRLRIGNNYTHLMEDMVQRFRFAVETLGMEGDTKENPSGERKLEHWRVEGGKKGVVNENFGVNLVLFSAGFVVA